MIATRQGKSLPEAKATNPARDFILWREFFEWEDNAHDRHIYHLAQIAAEVRKGHVKNPNLVKTEDFIAKFERVATKAPQEAEPHVIPDYDILEERVQNSKNFWMILAEAGAPEKKRPLPGKVQAATAAAKAKK